MKIAFKIIVSVCILILPCVLYSQETIPSNRETALGELKSYLTKRGYNTAALFSDPKFMIYDDIDRFFENSAENTGYKKYKEAGESGSEEDGEKVFQKELVKYKKRIGFNNKKRRLVPFMEKYSATLELSEQKYGVPRELTAAVIGVESAYGTISGKHIAVNVYISMYVKNYRTKWALEQLDELLRFSRNHKLDVYSFNSSYAGAIGHMQFLPWSMNRWFVGDDVTDMNDCIMSAANYISHFKEKKGTFEQAIYYYNFSRLYVQTVLDLAEYGSKNVKRNSLDLEK